MLAGLIEQLTQEGWRIGTLKHDVHGFDVDRPGKDTWRHRQAGARVSVILSGNQLAWMEKREESVDVHEIVTKLQNDASLNLILLEGFKKEPYPKVVFLKKAEDAALLREVASPLAVVSWFAFQHPGLPVFSLGDVKGLKHFILKTVLGESEDDFFPG